MLRSDSDWYAALGELRNETKVQVHDFNTVEMLTRTAPLYSKQKTGEKTTYTGR